MSNSLFTGSDDWKNNACLNWSLDTMPLYIDGYRKAADNLVHGVIESSQDQDVLVFPIAFLYRQYIELQLKYIIRESRIVLSTGNGFPEHHKINDLWNVANELMQDIIKNVDSTANTYITNKDIEQIGQIITNFVELDPDSFSFRYPKDKKGNKNLEGVTHINLRNLHEQIELLRVKLEKFDLVLALISDYQSDLRADYGP